MAAAPVYDEQKRPITAGGFVDSGPIVFPGHHEKSGLSGWIHKMGVPEKQFIIETNGSGVGLIDYDNDGWLDIYLVNGPPSPRLTARKRRRTLLYSTTTTTEPSRMSLQKRA